LPTPGAQVGFLGGDPQRRLQIIGIKNVIVIHKDEQIPFRFSNAPKASRRQAQLLFPNELGSSVPGKIDHGTSINGTGIVDQQQLPL
jgi:hypothetical protein